MRSVTEFSEQFASLRSVQTFHWFSWPLHDPELLIPVAISTFSNCSLLGVDLGWEDDRGETSVKGQDREDPRERSECRLCQFVDRIESYSWNEILPARETFRVCFEDGGQEREKIYRIQSLMLKFWFPAYDCSPFVQIYIYILKSQFYFQGGSSVSLYFQDFLELECETLCLRNHSPA